MWNKAPESEDWCKKSTILEELEMSHIWPYKTTLLHFLYDHKKVDIHAVCEYKSQGSKE